MSYDLSRLILKTAEMRSETPDGEVTRDCLSETVQKAANELGLLPEFEFEYAVQLLSTNWAVAIDIANMHIARVMENQGYDMAV